MRFEVLTEDRSGAVVVNRLMDRIVGALVSDYVISVRPHRGRGDLPGNPFQKPKPDASGLLDLLPAKLRAYDRVYAGSDFILVVVMDSDDYNPGELKDKLISICKKHAPSLRFVIGLCVEETESWVVGDEQALLKAYPEADLSILKNYEQDSICGTWEVLCRSILGNKADRLIKIGYPAIGQYKHEWALHISEYMDPARNVSPSFKRFCTYLSFIVRQTAESTER